MLPAWQAACPRLGTTRYEDGGSLRRRQGCRLPLVEVVHEASFADTPVSRSGVIGCSCVPSNGRVLTDQSVHSLAEQVGVPGVPAILLDQVAEEPAQAGLATFRIGKVDELVESAAGLLAFTASAQAEVQRVELVSGGGTNLHGAVCKTVQAMNERGGDATERLNGIVLLSDGADTTAEFSETRMFQTCLPASN